MTPPLKGCPTKAKEAPSPIDMPGHTGHQPSISMSQCMQSKTQLITHPVVFFNLLMLVVIKGHTHLNKPESLS